MSMLAERKRKTKWVVNPTKKPLWTTDPNAIKFGKGLMEKMGWSAGKGLGANEQGIQEPLKVSYKNDTKGMGFKGNDDDWIEHQDEFNCFLNQLRNCDESYVVRISDAEKNEVKSLEEKSKWSKARVHYQKFTRGKDLSKYSENDLACILGTNKTKNEKSKVKEVIQPEPNTNNNMETHFGVTTINSGSMQDYFKKKWVFHKNTKDNEGDGTVQNENSYFSTHEDDSCEVKDEKKYKKKKLKLNSEESVETVITPHSDDSEKLKKKKKKKKRGREVDSEEETENKRKKNDFDLINGFSEDFTVDLINNKEFNGNNDDCESGKFRAEDDSVFGSIDKNEEKVLKDQKKKKKKKDKEKLKNEDSICIENGVGSEEKHEDFEVEPILKKKKKSKKEKHLESSEDSKVSSDISDQINQSDAKVIESCSVIKKKKDKKEKSVKEEVEDCCSDVNVENFIGANKTEISSELVTKQKKKKEKIESAANIIPNLEEENKNTSLIEVSSEMESIRKKKKKKDKADINEVECPPEVEKNKKKGKKKNKRESEEVENLKNGETELDNGREEDKKSKKRQTLLESEPVKKKMKKSKKDRSSEAEDIEVTENNNETLCGLEMNEEITTEVGSGKKKKDKKEKIEFIDNDGVTITGDKKKKKKNKKKDKVKENSNDYTETQDSEFGLRENNSENEETNTRKDKQEKKNILDNSCEDQQSEDKDNKKSDVVNDKKSDFSTNKTHNNGYNKNTTNLPLTSLDFSNSYNSTFFYTGVLHQQNVNILNAFNSLYSYNYFNDALNAKNWSVDNENPIQSHKIEFLDAKRPDKFYPGQDQREKILRLIHLSDFSEFKGSNLEKLPGYGF